MNDKLKRKAEANRIRNINVKNNFERALKQQIIQEKNLAKSKRKQ